MTANDDTLTIHVNVDISRSALATIVETSKQMVGRNHKGVYRVDTADVVSRMITRFLQDKDFDAYVRHMENYGTIIPDETS